MRECEHSVANGIEIMISDTPRWRGLGGGHWKWAKMTKREQKWCTTKHILYARLSDISIQLRGGWKTKTFSTKTLQMNCGAKKNKRTTTSKTDKVQTGCSAQSTCTTEITDTERTDCCYCTHKKSVLCFFFVDSGLQSEHRNAFRKIICFMHDSWIHFSCLAFTLCGDRFASQMTRIGLVCLLFGTFSTIGIGSRIHRKPDRNLARHLPKTLFQDKRSTLFVPPPCAFSKWSILVMRWQLA